MKNYNPGDIVWVYIGDRQIKTTFDENGVQRLPCDPIYVSLWESGIIDLNNMAFKYQSGKLSFDDYLEFYLNFGYSVSGFAELSAFHHLEIRNKVWDNDE